MRYERLRATGVIVVAGLGLHAMFIAPDVENVPIERVTQNLERQVAHDPGNVRLRLNLARVHAMAWASKSQTAPVITDAHRVSSYVPGQPFFGVGGDEAGFQEVKVKPAADAADLADARRHLELAIRGYDEVLRIAPGHVVAMLGRAWCLDQAGDKARAIGGYRAVIAAVRADDQSRGTGNFKPTTIEVAGYLIPLLDPVKDSAELATLNDRIARIKGARPRPITPVVVPLRDDLPVTSLVNASARVRFDADGSGTKKRWSWITPNAAWLVFDRVGRKQVTSALQLFGNVTFWLFWDNGYEAMRALDDNGDGELSGAELSGLSLWRDANGDGIADPGEVRAVDDWGIVRLSCRYELADDPAMAAFSTAGVTFKNGVTRPTYDLLLYER